MGTLMVATSLAVISVIVGLGLVVYATAGRVLSFHRSMKASGGGKLGIIGELALGFFVLCLGLGAFYSSAMWAVAGISAWLVFFLSMRRANRLYDEAEEQLRATNSARYPGIFDRPPAQNIGSISSEVVDVYDAGTCTYLGQAATQDVKALIHRFGFMLDKVDNDIYLEPEFIDMQRPNCSQEFLGLLNAAFARREYLVIRWLPLTPPQA